jgi:NAD dependent epimerase/dehydratase family
MVRTVEVWRSAWPCQHKAQSSLFLQACRAVPGVGRACSARAVQYPAVAGGWCVGLRPSGSSMDGGHGTTRCRLCPSDLCLSVSLQVRVVRIFNTYGPHMALDDGRVVSNFVAQALTGQPLTVFGDGQQTRSFQYVSDLVAGAPPVRPVRPSVWLSGCLSVCLSVPRSVSLPAATGVLHGWGGSLQDDIFR